MPVDDYVAPPREAKDTVKLAWCRDAYKVGDALLRSQRAYKDLKMAEDMLAGEEPEDIPAELSRAYMNRLKRQTREAVAIQSQVNPSWFYEAPSEDLTQTASTLNKLLKAWWSTSFSDLKLRQANQYATGLGTGYLKPDWKKEHIRWGRGDIDMVAHGPTAVRLVQPTKDFNIQEAYATILTVPTPLNLARAMFPSLSAFIKPTRDVGVQNRRSQAQKIMQRSVGSLAMAMFGAGKAKERMDRGFFPEVDIHYMYIRDNIWNGSNHPMHMGQPGTSWEYEVPSRGDELLTNVLSHGQPTYRKAEVEDCLLYPMRRLMIFTDDVLLYDDTSPHWHGLVPITKITVDDWPWQQLGFGFYRDGAPLQREYNQVMRGIGDRINLGLRPPLGYDKNQVSRAWMNKFDPRKPGARIQINKQYGTNPIEAILPPEFLNIAPEYIGYLQLLADNMDHVSAVTDMRNLAKAKQIPSDATLDKILELAGPVVQDMTRVNEFAMAQLGTMVMSMFFQHYTSKRRIVMLGKEAMEIERFDFDPEDLWGKGSEMLSMMRSVDRGLPRFMKMREFMDNFRMMVVPNSLHEVHQTQYKLMMFQLWRDGRFPIDPQTIAEILKLRNFGSPFSDKPIYERWKAWMTDSTQFTVTLQAQAQMTAAAQGLMDMANQQNGGGGEPGGGGKPNGSGRQGRPPTAQSSPQLQTKGDGRTTVSESG